MWIACLWPNNIELLQATDASPKTLAEGSEGAWGNTLNARFQLGFNRFRPKAKPHSTGHFLVAAQWFPAK
jgi:hypothetical protein